MKKPCWSLPIWMNLERLNDSELIEMLEYIRDENGEKVNLYQLRRYLREKRAAYNQKAQAPE